MNLIVNHVPVSKKCRPGTKMTPTSITIHSTGNPDSYASGERKWLENASNDRTASWHYVVDESQVIEAIPPTEVAWHAGNDIGNKTSIGIEICETGDRSKVLANAKELALHLMRKYKIEKMVRHFD